MISTVEMTLYEEKKSPHCLYKGCENIKWRSLFSIHLQNGKDPRLQVFVQGETPAAAPADSLLLFCMLHRQPLSSTIAFYEPWTNFKH